MARSECNPSRRSKRRTLMATSERIGRPRVEAHRLEAGFGRTVVYENEVPRHNVHTRLVHWGVAIFFVAALLSGFAIFTPWLFAWISPLFGGGPRARLLHPWFGIGFVIMMTLQLRGWLNDMRWKDTDNQWLKRIREYVTHADE